MQEQQRLLDGRYQVIRKLGKGAWARTYLVEDTLVKRPDRLVVKQFKQPTSRTQAIKEFEALLKLFNPHNADPACRHLPWIYEVHPVDHEAHVIMDYVPGPTLKDVASEFPWPIEEWWSFARSLLSVLELLEEHHLLHRDIKPENIILHKGDRKQPVLIDFGFATPRSVTTTGAGTPGYLPPEAGWSRQPPESSDRYALSVLLFQMLTGKEPISELAADGYTRIVRMPPSVDKKVRPLAKVLLTAIATDPAQRPRSASELREWLEEAMKEVYQKYKLSPPESGSLKDALPSTPTPPVQQEDSLGGPLAGVAPMPNAPISIFISYSRSDSDFVDDLESDLSKQGFGTWVDRRRLEGGQKWRRELQAAIDHSQVLLVVLSPEAVASEPVQQEYGYALEEGKVVIPLYHRSCKVPLELRDIQYIDFRDGYDEGFASLLKALHRQQSHLPSHATSQVIRNRRAMLANVRTFWINGFLKESLHGEALIALGLSEQRDAVANPWRLILQQQNQPPRSLPSGTHITQVYDRVNGELLILGEPGSGKTTLLLELTRNLLDRAQKDETHPIPVVLYLSSWAVKRQPLTQWLIEELNAKYQIPRKVGQAWVDDDQLLLLLDGLDEVSSDYREACIDAINLYRSERGLVPMVVCSRSAELLMQTKRLQLQNAVVVQPLTREQIEEYLTSAGEKLAGVRKAYYEDEELQELVTTPLMLSVITLAYSGIPAEKLSVTDSLATRKQQVVATYVQRMLSTRQAGVHYRQQQSIHWLSWLARQLVTQKQTEFYLERMQLNWLPKKLSYRLYPSILMGLLFGLAVALIYGLYFALYPIRPNLLFGIACGSLMGFLTWCLFVLLNGLVFEVLGNRETKKQPEQRVTPSGESRSQKLITFLANRLAYGLMFGLLIGVLVGWLGTVYNVFYESTINGPVYTPGGQVYSPEPLTGIGYGLVNLLIITMHFAVIGKLDIKIHPAEIVAWSWKSVRHNLVKSIGGGLLIGLIYGVILGAVYKAWSLQIPIGLGIGVSLVLTFAVLSGLSHEMVSKEKIVAPNQGIRRSFHHSIVIGLVTGLIAGIAIGLALGFGSGLHVGLVLGLAWGLAIAVNFWLRHGGTACVLHTLLRICLWRANDAPLNYPRFLDFAVDHNLLRRVGGGYLFIHRLFLEHFAALYQETTSQEGTQQTQMKFQLS